jgi:hypothetical protein
LVALTRSSRRRRNYAAGWSFVLGLLAVAAVPVAIAVTEKRKDIELIWAAVGIPVALVFGVAAVLVGRRGVRAAQLTVGGRGSALARFGRGLGLLGLLLAGTGVSSLVVYAILTVRSR